MGVFPSCSPPYVFECQLGTRLGRLNRDHRAGRLSNFNRNPWISCQSYHIEKIEEMSLYDLQTVGFSGFEKHNHHSRYPHPRNALFYWVRLPKKYCGIKIKTGGRPSSKLAEKCTYDFLENEFVMTTYFKKMTPFRLLIFN